MLAYIANIIIGLHFGITQFLVAPAVTFFISYKIK